jgi:hypothetical protein
MAKKTPAHGGARAGAGRKMGPEGPAVVVAASLPQSLATDLDAYAEAQGVSRSAVVAEALRSLLNARNTASREERIDQRSSLQRAADSVLRSPL